jgi:F-type H+-transporting ATPase subunit gamma
MQMVAASRMRRAQEQVLATRPYATRAWQILTHLAAQRGADESVHPLLQDAEQIRNVAVVLITSDRGLSGSYNHNMIQRAARFVAQLPYPVTFITLGRRGRDAMIRLRRPIEADFDFSDMPPQPRLIDVSPIARVVIQGFETNKFDVVYLAHTDFVNTLVQKPDIWQLLPIRPLDVDVGAVTEHREGTSSVPMVGEYIYEPDPATILEAVLPRFTELQIYQAILESLASEHSARMVAMRNATDNANELLDDLTITFNRARQESITREMLDIAGGAEALSQAREM